MSTKHAHTKTVLIPFTKHNVQTHCVTVNIMHHTTLLHYAIINGVIIVNMWEHNVTSHR